MDLLFSHNIFYAVVLYKMLPVEYHSLTIVCHSHLSYKADIAWQHLTVLSPGLFSKVIISHQIPSSYIIGLKAGGTESKLFLSSISHYSSLLPLLNGIADVLTGLPFFFHCALLCPLQACLCTSENQPRSHGNLWQFYPWRCPCHRSTSLQEDTTAAAGNSCSWAFRPPFPNRCFPTQNLHPPQQCRGCCHGGGFNYSPAGVPLLCALLIGRHTQSSSIRLFHSGLKTSHWNKADKKNKEEKTSNRQGQAIRNQSWSNNFNLTNIHHLIRKTLPALCTLSSVTSICQIMHSLLRPGYYGCKKAFSPSWLLLQSNK